MSSVSRAGLAVYSVAFWILGFAWMLLVLLIAVPIRALGLMSLRVPLVQRPMGLVPWLNFTRIHVERHPDLDPARPAVYAQNHVNLFDAHTACNAIPAPFCGLMNAWQLRVPVYGWLMSITDGIPVSPSPLARARELPGAFRARAARGLSILTFPEAHRTPDGRVHEFKRGVIQLARDADLPVVPVAVRGMFRVMRKGSWIVRPGGRVTIWVGPQIETRGLDKRQMQQLTRALGQMVADYVDTGEVPDPGDYDLPQATAASAPPAATT